MIRKEKVDLLKIYKVREETGEEKPVKEQPKKVSVFSMFFGKQSSKYEKEVKEAERASKTSQKLLNSLFLDYVEISREEEKFIMSKEKKCSYCVQKIIAYALIVYGTYKFFMTIVILLILGRKKPIDPVTNFFRIMSK